MRFNEVRRVISAVGKNHGLPYLSYEVAPASNNKAGGDPVLINYDPVFSGKVSSSTFPRSMMLVVTVGDLGAARGELISGGISPLD